MAGREVERERDRDRGRGRERRGQRKRHFFLPSITSSLEEINEMRGAGRHANVTSSIFPLGEERGNFLMKKCGQGNRILFHTVKDYLSSLLAKQKKVKVSQRSNYLVFTLVTSSTSTF